MKSDSWKKAYYKCMRTFWNYSKNHKGGVESFFRADGFLLAFDIMHVNKPTDKPLMRKRVVKPKKKSQPPQQPIRV